MIASYFCLLPQKHTSKCSFNHGRVKWQSEYQNSNNCFLTFLRLRGVQCYSIKYQQIKRSDRIMPLAISRFRTAHYISSNLEVRAQYWPFTKNMVIFVPEFNNLWLMYHQKSSTPTDKLLLIKKVLAILGKMKINHKITCSSWLKSSLHTKHQPTMDFYTQNLPNSVSMNFGPNFSIYFSNYSSDFSICQTIRSNIQ